MAFTEPTYNINVNIWRFGNATTNPPDANSIANFAWSRRVSFHSGAGRAAQDWFPTMTLLLPSGTDIIGDINSNGSPDTVEIPAASGRYYSVIYVDYIGMGFDNEHLGAVVKMILGEGPPVPPTDFILLETGDFVLLESGDKVRLE